MPSFSGVARAVSCADHFCSPFPSARVTTRLPNMQWCENDISLWTENLQLKLKQVKILIIYIRQENISNNNTGHHSSVIQVVVQPSSGFYSDTELLDFRLWNLFLLTLPGEGTSLLIVACSSLCISYVTSWSGV